MRLLRPFLTCLGLALVASWAAATCARAEDGEVVELPEVVVRPPTLYAGPGDEGATELVTPRRREETALDVPRAVSVQDGLSLRQRRMVRSLPDALKRLPSVLVQKTAPMQSSPFIRGFTGYRNLLMIDGIRLNHSAFRSGPNQYWSTIDSYTIHRLELVRGPMSVLYGSDAVGGTVNVIPNRRERFDRGWHTNGLLSVRGASGEQSFATRAQFEGNRNGVGFLGGVTGRTFGNIISGAGMLPATGGVEELDGDIRFDVRLSRLWSLVVAAQHVGQVAAPRTHKTVFATPFRGTTVGSELSRTYDQDRDLIYARAVYENEGGGIPYAHVGVSWHHHREERDRLRSGDRRDLSGFDLDQLGLQAQVQTCTPIGLLTWGGDWYHDEADTWRQGYVGGALTSTSIQGPFGDDSRYDLAGLFVQDEISFGRLDLTAGARFTYARANANRVEDPTAPGSIIRVENDWTNVVGSLHGLYHVNRCLNVYGSVAQAFRAPTLYDLTSFDVTGFVDTPSPNLDAEEFVTFEVGTKHETDDLACAAAVYYTVLDDTIIRSPTGGIFDGTPVVRADNIGDGWVWGFELDGAWRLGPSWQLFGNLSWMDGEADELDPATGLLVRSPLSRQKPLSALLALRWEPTCSRWWAQGEIEYSAKEDRLSLRDKTDTSRIPVGGTPAWAVVNLRGGYRISDEVRLGVSLENLFDENYRIHGSGQNEPGLNLVVVLEASF